jgi:hypothetical protein
MDLRYAGQGYELRVALRGLPQPLAAAALGEIARRFHTQHAAVHGHSAEDADVEVVSYRLRAIAPMRKYTPAPEPVHAVADPQPRGLRRVTLGPEKKNAESSLQKRELVAYHEAGHAIVGALIPDYDQVAKITITPRHDCCSGLRSQGEFIVSTNNQIIDIMIQPTHSKKHVRFSIPKTMMPITEVSAMQSPHTSGET